MATLVKPSTVLVHQGSPGGIGQVELLLDRAFQAFGGRTTAIARQGVHALPHLTEAPRNSKGGFGLRVIATVTRMRPDLVVLSHLNLAPLAPFLRAVCPSTRIVCIAHGIEAWRPLIPSARFGLAAVDSVWCVSDFTSGMLRRESAVPARKLRLLPLAISDARVRLIESHHGQRPEDNSRPFNLLSVTRLHPAERYKGVEHVLLALAEVWSTNSNFIYDLVGEGVDRRALTLLATDLGIQANVNAVGSLDDSGLARALNACDAFILPSAKEGFGLAHLEAMSAARPVIAAHAGGTPEVVDQASGILVRYGDVKGLADSILQLIGDGTLCASLGAGGRSRFRKQFTEAAFQNRLQQLLDLV